MIDDFEIDRAAARPSRGNTVELPAMRALGFALIAGASALHNRLIAFDLTTPPRLPVAAIAAIAATYCLLSWLALRRWYREGGRVELGRVWWRASNDLAMTPRWSRRNAPFVR